MTELTDDTPIVSRPFPAVKLGAVVPGARLRWSRTPMGALQTVVGLLQITVRRYTNQSGYVWKWTLEPIPEPPLREVGSIDFGFMATEDGCVQQAEAEVFKMLSDALSEFSAPEPKVPTQPEFATARIGGLTVVHFDDVLQVTDRSVGLMVAVSTHAPFAWRVSYDTRPELPEAAFTGYDGHGSGVADSMIGGVQAAFAAAQAARKEASDVRS